ncbi:MAG: hypothetical protein WC333_08365, partial [Dehalococcoidia bacterium]
TLSDLCTKDDIISPGMSSTCATQWITIQADIKEFLCALKIGGDYGQWVRDCKEMQKQNIFILEKG